MDSNSLLTSLMQLAERSKRNLRAAPGQIADQVSNFIPDWKATSAAVPAAIKSNKTNEEVFKKAIEETAGNAIPGGAGVAGIFGGAGRQDLFAARGTSIDSLLRRIFASKRFAERQSWYDSKKAVSAAPIVQHPSIAINKTDPRNNDFYEDALVIYNPAAIDPANTWRSHLVNRDSYSYRSGDVASGIEALRRVGIDRKNATTGRPVLLDPRMTESWSGNHNGTHPDAHGMQIFNSPEFKSFAEYEASPAGAATLDAYDSMGNYSVNRMRGNLDNAMTFYMNKLARNGEQLSVKNMNKLLDSEGTTTAKAVKDLLQRAPSNYAELKYRGPLPINSETTLAVLLRNANKKDQNTISSALRGVQVINDKQLLGTDEVLELLQAGARNPHLARVKKQIMQPTRR